MIPCFKDFVAHLNTNSIKMINQQFSKTIQRFNFSMILNNQKLDQPNLQKITKSKFIIIDTYIKKNEKYIIACFDRQILISELINEPIVSSLFSEKNINKISFVSSAKLDFLDEKTIKLIKSNEDQIEEEVDSLVKSFQIHLKNKDSVKQFWNIIKSCISTYLIKKNHVEFINDRFKKFFENIEKTNEQKNYKEEDFIFLRRIAKTESSAIDLVYHIESENIYVIKHFSIYQEETPKLTFRELDNYEKLKYPLIPQFYGQFRTNDRISFVIEFIKGKTLDQKIELNDLIFEQKLMIIIELLFTFQYLHRNKFIYRDLKPNNVIIDQNNKIVLIDFDRMIYYKNNQTIFTADLNSPCLAPEFQVENYIPSFENDIYSIGRIICYIITGKYEIDSEFQKKYPDIYPLLNKSCSENVNARPTIDELIILFDTLILYTNNFSMIRNIEINISLLVIADSYSRFIVDRYDYDAMLFIWFIYYEGKYITRDLNKCAYYLAQGVFNKPMYSQYIIGHVLQNCEYAEGDLVKSFQYLELSAKQNHPDSLTFLGNSYYEGYVIKDINKAIDCYNLAAKQNHPGALIRLSYIYMEDEDVELNLEKSTHYIELAEKYYANKYTPYIFGKLFYDGVMLPCDKKKGVQYYKLAAKQNDTIALCEMGDIYLKGEYEPKNINKAIQCYSLAADQKHVESLEKLGGIYYEGMYVPLNIDKAIHFYKLAADLDSKEAMKILGDIYLRGVFVPRNISNAIHYYSCANCLNDSNILCDIGDAYFESNNSPQDIDEAIRYYTLSASLNYIFAMKKLGAIYYEGKSVPQNIEMAIKYYTLSADRSDKDSMKKLGDIYLEGKHVPQNISKAIYYYSRAKYQYTSSVSLKIGDAYFEGKNAPQDIEEALYYYTLSASQNNIKAMQKLGDIYYEGKYVQQNINIAIEYYLLSANNNNSTAQFKIGNIFYRGKYIPRNINIAIHYFKKMKNNWYLQYFLGVIYYEGFFVPFDINKSIHYFQLAADQNDKRSLFILGYIHYEGKYVQFDINKSIHYFTLAAEQNDLNSQYFLGAIYCEGKYVTHNINKALQYFSLAENQNHSIADNIINFIYNENKYLKNDIEQVIRYLIQSSKRNNQIAQYYLGVIFYEDRYIKRDIDKSIYYFTLSAKQNNSYAQNNLGYILYEGKYVKRDTKLAIKYLIDASKQNNPIAQNNLGCIYYEGKYILYNIHNTILYFTKSSDNNFHVGQYNFGSIYLEGKRVEKSIDKAIYYLSLAADQNLPEAQYKLGIIYYKGIGIKQNIKKSFKYMNLASKNDINQAHLFLADFYFEGKYIKRDIRKAFNLYKKVSSFYNQYAKNNLGVIYKNGYDVVKPNINNAKLYFEEAIKEKNDCLSMFNLANILLEEEDKLGQEHNKSIKLLIDSARQDLIYSQLLLCLLLYIKHKNVNVNIIQDELIKQNKGSNQLALKIYRNYENFLSIDAIYRIVYHKDLIYIHYQASQLIQFEQENYLLCQKDDLTNKTDQFNDGFGYDLL